MKQNVDRNEWKSTLVSEIAKVNENSINANFHFDEIEYIDIASVEAGKINNIQKLMLKEAPSRAKRIVKDNDILISTVRPNLRHYCFIKQANQNTIASTGFAVITAKRADPYFLYCLLTTHDYTDYLTKIAEGHTSTYPSFNPEVIENSSLLLPPLPEQRAIAAFILSLDNKIELLHRQNKTLEQIAQTIFKEWFIEFNFPDKNGKPYKTSGGKMIDSELGPIPEGWKVGILEDIAIVDWGNTSITKDSYTDLGKYLGVSAAGCDGRMVHKEYDYGAFVISAIGEYCGKVFLPGEDFTAIKNTLVVRQRNSEYSYFTYLGIQRWPMHRRGAAQPFLSKGDTEQIPLPNPGLDLIKSFTNLITPLFIKLRSNLLQINSLAKTRNHLLPKLMSGQLRVKPD
jgi:type I restriction enzyme, S subunit